MAEYIRIYPENPQQKALEQVVEVLRNGGLVIYPTDSIYGIGCDIFNQKAVNRLCQIKGERLNTLRFSFICHDLSDISTYAKNIDNVTFKAMKKAFPGPYTFILNSSSKVPKMFNSKKKQVGIRVPNHPIPKEIVRLLGNPIMTTSVIDEDEVIEYTTDPSLIYDKYEKLVDIVIDGGYGSNIPSTVIDCSSGTPEILREGQGPTDIF